MKESTNSILTLPKRARSLAQGYASSGAVRMLTRALVSLALSFLLAGASIAGAAMPFAVSLIAVSQTPLLALSAMLGSAAGYLYFWGIGGGLEYLAVGVLIFAAVCIVGGGEMARRRLFMPALSACMALLVGFLFLVQAHFAPAAIFSFAARLLLTLGTAWAFSCADTTRRDGFLLYGLVCLLMGAAACHLVGGITLGQIFAAAVCAAAVSTPQGLLLCAACGLALDIAAPSPVSLCALLCFAGVLCKFLPLRMRAAQMLAFLSAITLGVFFTRGLMPELILSAAAGCCLSLLIPAQQLTAAAHEGTTQQLSQAALILEDIHKTLAAAGAPSPDAEAAEVFDRASEQVCAECGLRRHCWTRASTDTYNALCAVAPPMLAHGMVTRDNFPKGFSDRCCHLDALVGAINRELDTFAGRRQYQSRLRESREIVAAQYAILSSYLRRAASSLQREDIAGICYAPELGVSAAGRQGHSISGDRGACFRTGDGMYYILLCDGMGSGAEAANESSSAIKTLAGLIRAGLDARSALETLNGVYVLRGDGGFSTVDLLAVSLVSGEATLYKWGAAFSYYKARVGTKKLGTASPPPGFGVGETHKAAEYKLSLRKGEMLVLVSDGADGEDVGNKVAAWEDGAPKALAAALIAESKAKGEDDMTAVALQLRPCSARA